MEAGHEVHVFDGLGGGAFEQVVERGDDDQPAMRFFSGRGAVFSCRGAVELEAEVAEVGARDVLDLGEGGRAADADERGAGVEVVEAELDFFHGALLV